MSDELDLYAVLNVSPDANAEEIKRAYRLLARQYHPDAQSAPGTAALFRQIQEAYDVLSEPNRRAAYDRRLAEAGLSPQSLFQWKIQSSRSILPTVTDEQALYVLFDISSSQSDQAGHRVPLNVCLVLDRSTSMQGSRLDQTKAAALRVIDSLESDDTLGVVTFSDRAEIVWPNQPLSDPIRARAKVSAIQASGGTEIYQGMSVGLAELEKRRRTHVINHLILLTDGQTYGDEEKCLAAADDAKKQRIGISAMGIGEDWNDALLDELASRSGGISQYIASTGEIQHFLKERLHGLGAVYGDNMRLTLNLPEDVRLKNTFKLSPYIQRLELDNGSLALGTLQADAPLSGVIELVIGARPAGLHKLIQLELTGDIPAQQIVGERLERSLTYLFDAQADLNTPAPAMVLSALAKVTIFQMQEGAWKSLEEGDIAGATHRLETMATRLLDMGEHQLARAALLEAGRLARSGSLSSAGRKTIKYGTRSLLLPPAKESEV
jgi:Ca-activated chloride channel family protein